MNFSYSGVSNGLWESMRISVMLECSVAYQKMGIWLVFSFKGNLNFYKILSHGCEPCLTLQTWKWWLSGPSPCRACVCNGFDAVPGLKTGGEGEYRGWNCWMASLTQCSLSKFWELVWKGKPGMLQSMGFQRVGHGWVIEWTEYCFISIYIYIYCMCIIYCILYICIYTD